MSDQRITCRECVFSQKKGKGKDPVRPGMVFCTFHRKEVHNNYTCGQAKKR